MYLVELLLKKATLKVGTVLSIAEYALFKGGHIGTLLVRFGRNLHAHYHEQSQGAVNR